MKYFLTGIVLGVFSIVFGYAIGIYLLSMQDAAGAFGFVVVAVVVLVVYGLLALLAGSIIEKIMGRFRKAAPANPTV